MRRRGKVVLRLRKNLEVPHAGGEDCGGCASLGGLPETPPRGWGRLKSSNELTRAERNTPTRVGKTLSLAGKDRMREKHPHAGGEDGYRVYKKKQGVETPPRGWGRRSGLFFALSRARNTPTRVGKTKIMQIPKKYNKKHPHAGGEDTGILLDVFGQVNAKAV